jgi:sulfatase maturation enzyme AslB (radical SAM superfamily)
MKIFWLQPEDTRLGAGQRLIEQKTGSYSFCALPWIHVATRPNGDARLCCVTNASGAHTGDHTVGLVKKEDGEPANFGKQLPLEAFNNDYMKSVRKTMLDGKIPASCTKCFEEESNGVVSKRLWEAYEWDRDGLDFKQLIADTAEDGTVPPVIRYFDLRLGHTCNLKCVMCSPHDSSRWVEDHKKIVPLTKSTIVLKQIEWSSETFDNYWYEKPELWEQIFEQIPNITQLYFAGGEPLMIKEHRRFLDEIIKRGYAKNISLRYNSNGVLVNEDIINIWSKFKQVRMAFSIDALEIRNGYIRYPVDWEDTLTALRLLDNAPDNVHCAVACAVQIMNIKHIIDFAKWKLTQGFKKINKFTLDDYQAGGGIINLHLLYIPTFLSARILPQADKEQLVNDFAEFKQWLWDNYTQDDNFWKHNPYGWKRWEGILKFVLAEDHSHLLPDFAEYVHNLDSIRGTDFKETFPELGHLV